jgi:hypothetical protein
MVRKRRQAMKSPEMSAAVEDAKRFLDMTRTYAIVVEGKDDRCVRGGPRFAFRALSTALSCGHRQALLSGPIVQGNNPATPADFRTAGYGTNLLLLGGTRCVFHVACAAPN